MVGKLFELQDLKYREFHAKLIPSVDKNLIIGVRVPDLRRLAREFSGSEEAKTFMDILPHRYYEENNLHAFLVEQIGNFDMALYETERFLPYIDNWATCDMFYPKVFKKNRDRIAEKIDEWIKSDKCYTVRYAIGLLLRGDFTKEDMEKVACVKSEEYYVKMMIAWYFATALFKNYECAVKYFEENVLDDWVHNKAIQKAKESLRIDRGTKAYLMGLRR